MVSLRAPCIAVAYLLLRAVEAWIVRGSEGFGLVRRMGLIVTAIVLATLINPYSYRLPLWLFESLGVPRIEISDWSSGQLATMVGMKFWCLIGVAVFAIGVSAQEPGFCSTGNPGNHALAGAHPFSPRSVLHTVVRVLVGATSSFGAEPDSATRRIISASNPDFQCPTRTGRGKSFDVVDCRYWHPVE